MSEVRVPASIQKGLGGLRHYNQSCLVLLAASSAARLQLLLQHCRVHAEGSQCSLPRLLLDNTPDCIF